MKVPITLPILLGCLFSWCHAEDWTTKEGRTYHDVRVSSVNVDSVSVTYDGGTGRLYLRDLTPELQKRFREAAIQAQAFAVVEKNAATDPIAHLVVTLSSSHGMWVNGMCQILRLPESAPPEQLAARTMQDARIRNYKIANVEKVQIQDTSGSFTAILVHTLPSDKIVLVQYVAQGQGWWSRVFDSGR